MVLVNLLVIKEILLKLTKTTKNTSKMLKIIDILCLKMVLIKAKNIIISIKVSGIKVFLTRTPKILTKITSGIRKYLCDGVFISFTKNKIERVANRLIRLS